MAFTHTSCSLRHSGINFFFTLLYFSLGKGGRGEVSVLFCFCSKKTQLSTAVRWEVFVLVVVGVMKWWWDGMDGMDGVGGV